MGAVQRTIAKYSLLEQKLLGVANAYEKFEEAQTSDSEKDYRDNAYDLLTALIEGLQTGEIGIDTFQVAFEGIVPKGTLDGLNTVEEKVAAIANYITNSSLKDYFTFDFNDDGSINDITVTLDNVKKFIEDGLSGKMVLVLYLLEPIGSILNYLKTLHLWMNLQKEWELQMR